MSSQHITGRAGGIVTLPPGDPEREAAYEHARGCEGCTRELEEAARLIELLDDAGRLPPPSHETLNRVAALVAADPGETAPLRSPWPAAAGVVLGWSAFATLAKHHSHKSAAWIESLIALGIAAATTLLAKRLGAWGAVVVCVASAALVVATGAEGDLAVRLGLKCVVIELVAAALPSAAIVRGILRTQSPVDAGELTATAAAGALAGQAALQVTCVARASMPHLLAFHLGGVLLAALLGGLVARPLAQAKAAGRRT
jgi:hypothetical protein